MCSETKRKVTSLHCQITRCSHVDNKRQRARHTVSHKYSIATCRALCPFESVCPKKASLCGAPGVVRGPACSNCVMCHLTRGQGRGVSTLFKIAHVMQSRDEFQWICIGPHVDSKCAFLSAESQKCIQTKLN